MLRSFVGNLSIFLFYNTLGNTSISVIYKTSEIRFSNALMYDTL